MAKSVDSQVRAKVWVTPGQVDQMRTAVLQASADYLAEQSDAMLALLCDAGLRVGELVEIDVEFLREQYAKLYSQRRFRKTAPRKIPRRRKHSRSRAIPHARSPHT